MKFLHTQPIRRQVLVAACLLVLPLVVAVLWSANRTRREREGEVRDQAASVATTAAAILDEYFASLDAMASVLVRHPAVRGLNRAECNLLFLGLLREQPLLQNVVLRAADGSLVAAAAGDASVQPPPADVVAQVIATGRPVVSELTTGPITGRLTVLLAYPVHSDQNDESITGSFGFSLNLTRLQTAFASVSLPEGSVVSLVDRNSRVLARSREAERYIGTAYDAVPREPKDVPQTLLRAGLDGVERYYGHAVIDRGPWLLSVGIPRSVATNRLGDLWFRNLTISISAFFAVLLLALWVSRHMSRDLDRLRLAAQRIADGDLSPPVEGPVPNLELGQLRSAFTTMAARLRDMRDTLDRQVEQERKMRETLQSLQRQVVRQERLAAVGVLVSGVAHELNNPLQAILGTAEILERQGNLSPEILNEIAFVKTQSGRAREIIRNLSRFSSQQSGPPSHIDLREVIGEVVQLRRRDLSNSSIALDIETSSVRKVYANFTELEQVTLNFVINAQQAIEASGRSSGRILIRLSDIGKKVRLAVLDNGPGVSPQDEPKLFQPFFTTKPVGKGTGLGLSVSYGIVDSYGGTIGYNGNEWGGATFFFELPATESQSADDPTPVLRGSVLPRV